jgi:hypothetical protein
LVGACERPARVFFKEKNKNISYTAKNHSGTAGLAYAIRGCLGSPPVWPRRAGPCLFSLSTRSASRSLVVTGSIPRCTSLCCITASMSGQFPSGGGLARPSGRASKHDQMFIELNSLGLNVSTSSEVEAGETADHA